MSEAETKPDAQPPAKPRMSLLRRSLIGVAGLLLLLLSLPIGAWFVMPRLNLADLAAERASAMLGRRVTIESLHITPGQRVRVSLKIGRAHV